MHIHTANGTPSPGATNTPKPTSSPSESTKAPTSSPITQSPTTLIIKATPQPTDSPIVIIETMEPTQSEDTHSPTTTFQPTIAIVDTTVIKGTPHLADYPIVIIETVEPTQSDDAYHRQPHFNQLRPSFMWKLTKKPLLCRNLKLKLGRSSHQIRALFELPAIGRMEFEKRIPGIFFLHNLRLRQLKNLCSHRISRFEADCNKETMSEPGSGVGLSCTGWKNRHQSKSAPNPFTKKTMIAPEFGVVLSCIQFDSSLRAQDQSHSNVLRTVCTELFGLPNELMKMRYAETSLPDWTSKWMTTRD